MKLLVIAAAALASLYANPQRVEIEGFNEDAEEPCISLDGRTLYWSGANDSNKTGHLYWAKRVGDLRFKYMGRMNNVLTKEREMAPSLDYTQRIYYTNTATFGYDHRSIYWTQGSNDTGHAVLGDISDGCGLKLLGTQFDLNMDCCVSPDGNTMILSRAHFNRGESAPRSSKLFIARKQPDGTFRRDPASHTLMRAINTAPLQYAPAITADGLELYFTRATLKPPLPLETMVATRKSVNEPFGTPVRLPVIEGFSEAPSLTLDRKELYFHHQDPVTKRFSIYRVTRRDDCK